MVAFKSKDVQRDAVQRDESIRFLLQKQAEVAQASCFEDESSSKVNTDLGSGEEKGAEDDLKDKLLCDFDKMSPLAQQLFKEMEEAFKNQDGATLGELAFDALSKGLDNQINCEFYENKAAQFV